MKYFDYAATCPMDEEVMDAYVKASRTYYGNSESLHDMGGKATNLLESCRSEWGRMLGVQPQGVYFTSGGTESNFLGIQALISANQSKGKHIITSVAEHSSIHNTMAKLEQQGYQVTYLPYNGEGFIDLEALRSAITHETIIVSIQHGNSEIGTLQPIQEIGDICREHHIYFHSDCVQTFGKIDITEVSGVVDSLSISSHKIYGPKGMGAVYIRPQIPWQPYLPNVSHEKGLRPGTVNVPGVAAFTVAAQKAEGQLQKLDEHFSKLRSICMTGLTELDSRLRLYGSRGNRQLPGIIGLRIQGMEGQWLMLECNRLGFAISTGSACQVGKQEASKTMHALSIPRQEAKEFVRISFGRETTQEEVSELTDAILQMI